MDQRVQVGRLAVAASLHRFVVEEALPGSGRRPAMRSGRAPTRSSTTSRPATGSCWPGATSSRPASTSGTASTPAPPTREAYTAFLREIGYLLDEPADVAVTTAGVDDEVARIAGPQLVVPLLNARFATNAVNARWGSLYDALYGSDVVPQRGRPRARRAATTRCAATRSSPAAAPSSTSTSRSPSGSHADATAYAVDDDGLAVTVKDDVVRLADPGQLVGFRGDAEAPGGRAAGPPRAARRDPGRPRGRDRLRPTRPASRTCCSSPRSPRSWTSRTRWPRSTPRTRCSATATGCS